MHTNTIGPELNARIGAIRLEQAVKLQTVIDRFWPKVEKTETCWLWTGCFYSTGYGRFLLTFKPKPILVKPHRFSWVLHNGPIRPLDTFVLHTCDIRPCVNPDHLYLGDFQANMKDRHDRGRSARGEGNGNSKLTKDQIRRIIERGIESSTVLGKEFGASPGHIRKILRREFWI